MVISEIHSTRDWVVLRLLKAMSGKNSTDSRHWPRCPPLPPPRVPACPANSLGALNDGGNTDRGYDFRWFRQWPPPWGSCGAGILRLPRPQLFPPRTRPGHLAALYPRYAVAMGFPLFLTSTMPATTAAPPSPPPSPPVTTSPVQAPPGVLVRRPTQWKSSPRQSMWRPRSQRREQPA